MRDTERVRLRLEALLACVPLAGAGAATLPGCQGEPPVGSESADRVRSAALPAVKPDNEGGGVGAAEEGASARSKTAVSSATAAAQRHVGPASSNLPELPGYLIGDPPLVEGYHAEEDACLKGNWCGPHESAAALASARSRAELGCPSQLSGSVQGSGQVNRSAPVYAGLSGARSLQATFQSWRTARQREASSNEDLCCYHWFEYCSGRAWVDEGKARTAELRPTARGGWGAPDLVPPGPPVAPALSDAMREWMVAAWRHDAKHEHASVASFARSTLELLAVGGPPELVSATLRAGGEEVRHAQACLSLAEHYGGAAVAPANLPILGSRDASLTRLVRDVFLEACVGETIATLRAERQLRDCEPEGSRGVLQMIAEEEARHAALGWSTVRWALKRGGAPVREALTDVVCTVEARARQGFPSHQTAGVAPTPAGFDVRLAARHGRLSPAADRQVILDAWTEIIGPLAEDLLCG
ncbi:MAG: ferritin-like domain-containing protein [Nannocystaceae bacterium]